MNIVVWKVKGFNDPLKQNDIISRIKRLNFNLVCLVETKVKEDKNKVIVDKVFKGWGQLQNYSSTLNGMIWILWSSSVQENGMSAMDQCITCSVSFESKQF